ncbi:probable ATP-dependent RNA helicase DDX28 [Sphaerodactylus townsendi]|uniref:probable ATP-dependent RNA helicase DDX28 n=1 Tax=Sphaerodactylus townsendi TaxID=933632 RepID=UPI002027554C|nr:probable ATP-dependent RNA helicase DDX28 [Sphaerodactylus townsendi]
MALSFCAQRPAAFLRAPGQFLLSWPRLSSRDPPLEETVIRIPRAWQLRLQKVESKAARRARLAAAAATPNTRAGKLLLRTRREDLSQGTGFVVGRWERPRLVSDGWKHRLSRGDYFQLERTKQELPQARDKANSSSSFPELGVEPQVAAALQDALAISEPTAVQKQAIPVLLGGHNALCAAETGSGKTLAYLLPLIQRLLLGESLFARHASIVSPRGMIVLPSRELAGQVRSIASYLCVRLGLQVREIGGGRGMAMVRRKLCSGPTDLLVTTPGALCKALRRRMLSLEKLCFLVLDEVDTLLDPSFVDLVEDILQQTPFATNSKEVNNDWDPKTQLVAMGATLPKGLGDLLSKVTDLSSFSMLTSYYLHRLQPHVEQKFVRLKGSDKVSELLQLLKDQNSTSGAVLIFCSGARTVNWLGYILDDHKVKHVRLQGQMPAAMRADIFTRFQTGQFNILVCTDIASRGLDTTRVELVVNYDFPPTLHDYLHRVGRVGRVGSKFPGTVISFVTHKWDVDLVKKIEMAARKRAPLPGMEAPVKKP